jgi:hypothetical protein
MSLQLESTKVLLQSDDSLWYWLSLVQEADQVYTYIDTNSDTPISGSDAFANILGSDSNIYKLSLVSITGEDPALTVNPYLEISSGSYIPYIPLTLNSSTYSLGVFVEDTVPYLELSLLSTSYATFTYIGKPSFSLSSFPKVILTD